MEKGFAPEGYITDQDCFPQLIYRGIGSNINGCGWIAAHNFLLALGMTPGYETVHRDMNAFFPRQIPGPTPVRVLRRYLRRFGAFPLAVGRKKSLATGRTCRAGILRYWEGKEPHFIAFVPQEGGLFRFFNVCDGGEDMTLSLEEFFRTHCRRGLVRLIVGK